MRDRHGAVDADGRMHLGDASRWRCSSITWPARGRVRARRGDLAGDRLARRAGGAPPMGLDRAASTRSGSSTWREALANAGTARRGRVRRAGGSPWARSRCTTRMGCSPSCLLVGDRRGDPQAAAGGGCGELDPAPRAASCQWATRGAGRTRVAREALAKWLRERPPQPGWPVATVRAVDVSRADGLHLVVGRRLPDAACARARSRVLRVYAEARGAAALAPTAGRLEEGELLLRVSWTRFPRDPGNSRTAKDRFFKGFQGRNGCRRAVCCSP